VGPEDDADQGADHQADDGPVHRDAPPA
jgi:hypothetical protein